MSIYVQILRHMNKESNAQVEEEASTNGYLNHQANPLAF
jgi:hypothetical protein